MALDQLPQYRDILPAGAAAVLLIEHVGESETQVREKVDATDRVVGKQATGRTVIMEPKAQARIWKSRKDAGPLLYRKRSRKHPAEFMEDVSVDHRRLADYLAGLERIQKKHGITMCFFGHAGDGELHVRPYIDLGDPADRQKMLAIAEDVYALTWSLGGTISGEHAVGLIRAGFVRRQYGDEYYAILQKIKEIFDPTALMNPGKILNDEPDVMFKNLRRSAHILPERARSELLFKENDWSWNSSSATGAGCVWAGSRRCACVPCSGRWERSWAAPAPRPICFTTGRRGSLRKRTSSRRSSASSGFVSTADVRRRPSGGCPC
jgi:hypothetical protein